MATFLGGVNHMPKCLFELTHMKMKASATSKSTQFSTKVCIKLLLLLENAIKLNYGAL